MGTAARSGRRIRRRRAEAPGPQRRGEMCEAHFRAPAHFHTGADRAYLRRVTQRVLDEQAKDRLECAADSGRRSVPRSREGRGSPSTAPPPGSDTASGRLGIPTFFPSTGPFFPTPVRRFPHRIIFPASIRDLGRTDSRSCRTSAEIGWRSEIPAPHFHGAPGTRTSLRSPHNPGSALRQPFRNFRLFPEERVPNLPPPPPASTNPVPLDGPSPSVPGTGIAAGLTVRRTRDPDRYRSGPTTRAFRRRCHEGRSRGRDSAGRAHTID